MDFLGMGWPEIILILIVALIVLGPEKLPEYVRTFGKYYRKFRQLTNGVTSDLRKAVALDEDENGESLMSGIDEIRASLQKDADDLRASLNDVEDDSVSDESLEKTINDSLKDAKDSVNESLKDIDIDDTPKDTKNPNIWTPADKPVTSDQAIDTIAQQEFTRVRDAQDDLNDM